MKSTGSKLSFAVILTTSMLLPSLNARAETRLGYGAGVSYCSSDFEACDNAAVVGIGVEQSLNEASSFEVSFLGGGMFFSGDYNSYSLHYKRKLSPHTANSFFIAAGPHYYQVEDDGPFADIRSRSGFGVSTKIGWQRYQRSGFGIDAGIFAKTMPGSDITIGLIISVSYGFNP